MDPDDDPETTLDRLEACSADEPRLVSVYVPPGHLIDEAIVSLGRQREDLDGVRSEDRRERTEETLVRLQDRLAEYDESPERGMALFCGRLDGDWIETTLESPPAPVEGFRYACERSFLTDPFYDLLEKRVR